MNNYFKNKKQAGFIQSVIIIVGCLILLKYTYNIDVVGYLTEGRFRDLIDKFYALGKYSWQKYYSVIQLIIDEIGAKIKILIK